MGCNSSRYVVNINMEGQGIDCQRALKLLKLEDNEIDKLYSCFVKFDLSGDGQLSLIEFLTMLDLDETFLTKEIFDQMDSSGDKSLNFKEFVLSVWRYCVMTKKQISEMVFELYDGNGNGELNDTELKQMITAMYANKTVQYDMNKLLKTINHSRPGIVEKKEFIEATLKNQALLFPAFHMQKVLQDKICGVSFWSEQSIKSGSVLSNPEVQGLFRKRRFSSPKHVSTVTPIIAPSNKLPTNEGLVLIDFGSTQGSEKITSTKDQSKRERENFHKHHPTVYVSQHSVDSSTPSVNQSRPKRVIHKQHTTGHDSTISSHIETTQQQQDLQQHHHSNNSSPSKTSTTNSTSSSKESEKWPSASRDRRGHK